MVHKNVVTLDDMRDQLHTLDWAREQFAKTEPLTEIPFEAGDAELRLAEDWCPDGDIKHGLTDYTGSSLHLPGGVEYALSKQAALEIGAAVGIPRKVQANSDPELLAGLVNWRLREVLDAKGLKALGHNDGHVLALTRGTVSPFSNLALLDVIVAGLEKRYGTGCEILADYKFYNDVEHTGLRLIVPGYQRVITGTAVPDDTWSTGIDYANSLTGLKPTDVNGQLFRWWCTNGCTDTLHSVGALPRRGTTQEDALAWAAETVEEVLGGLEDMLDHVQELTAQPIAGDVRDTLDGLFQEYGIPGRNRSTIIESMAEDEEMTAYSLMQAVTEAANQPDMADQDRQRLMRMGGGIAGTHSRRCSLGRVHRVVQAEVAEEGQAAEEFYAEHGAALAAEETDEPTAVAGE